MKELINCINSKILLNENDIFEISSKFNVESFKKKSLILQEGQTCQKLYFIKSGFLRLFRYADKKELTVWIGSPDTFITSVASFTFRKPSLWNIQSITDSKLFSINIEEHNKLSQINNKWLEFDNILLINAYEIIENKFVGQLDKNAEEKFEILMKTNPDLFNNVPLNYISSMLGMTPETLSRLRNKSIK